MRVSWAAIAAFAAASALPAHAQACAPKAGAEAAIVQTMRDMYESLKADDIDGFHAVTASDFFTFDGGKRFDGDALMALIKAAHDRGAVYDWSVAEPKVEVDCSMALLTYVNIGSLTEKGETRPLTWLESTTMVHDGRRWRIRFFHSTRQQP